MQQTIGVAVIGAGLMGSIHAKAYAKLPGVQVIAVADTDRSRAESLAAQFGARAETDADAVVADPAVQVVDVAVPTPLHPTFAIRALEASKHVVVEKPLALSLREADAMLAAAERTGRFLMVGHVLRFWPEYVAARDVLRSERLGRPLLATAHRLSNMPQWSEWFRDPSASGGAVLDLHIHDIDLLNWLFGRPNRVVSSGVKDASGGWNHVITLLEYSSVCASAEASFMMPQDYPFTAGLRIVFERGVVEYGFDGRAASIEGGHASSLRVYEPGRDPQELPVEEGDPYEREIAYFVACVRSGQPPDLVTPADARLAVKVALAARAALETGEPITLSGGDED